MQPLQKYKKTKLGEIPEEWNIISLHDVCKNITDGKHGDCQNEHDSGYYFISAKDIFDGKVHYENARQITKSDFLEAHKRTKIESGDILLTNSGSIGKLAIVQNVFNTARTTFQKSVAILKPDIDKIFVKFFYYYLYYNQKQLETIASGSSQKNLLLRQLASFKIFLPSIHEQQKIGSILSNVDELIQKTDQIIEQTQRLKKGLMQRLLTKGIGHSKFKKIKFTFHEFDIPEEWILLSIQDITEFVTYGLTVRPKYLEEGIPLISAKEIRTGEIDFQNAAKISKNDYNSLSRKERGLKDDVFFSKTGTIGLVARAKVNLEFAITQNIASLRPKKSIILPEFLEMFLKSDFFLKAAYRTINTTTIPDLQLGEIKKIKIPIPNLDEQKKISCIFELVYNELECKRQLKLGLEMLKKGLMQQLLTGKIRVKV